VPASSRSETGADGPAPVAAVITGLGVAAAGVNRPDELLADGLVPEPAEFDPAARLGRRGLRYKDQATRSGLLAATLALTDAGLLDEAGQPATDAWDDAAFTGSFAVVVSSNLGNLDTVCSVADTIDEATVTGTSPMDLPNASSNVIASSVAIRFGMRGPNLTLCNGATSGLDAMYWATRLLASGRADRVLVIGAETVNSVVDALLGGPARRFDGAAALVVETRAAAAGRGARPYAVTAGAARETAVTASTRLARQLAGTDDIGLWLAPGEASALRDTARLPAPVDLDDRFGSSSGALGVLQCVAAAAWLASRAGAAGSAVPAAAMLTCGGAGDDAVASLVLTGPVGAA
jgi:3-oxoacyl-[acyl-carrier-protein] synthase II